ncbi:malonyl-CoA:pyruvate transcarboxylase [Monocercomonoides exilis]|uniref:malonyl-CoA:pyruvate transcarboxylase n=1 Tax=Monocercomonoides exilis TaxID=2049356 RepID=UPI00355AA656|nr:malonyl-CoA:pyruvate transcarboxylase [Monocercomonoides exilis]|eukprot:MONOS_6708.1-p1 / transcript=MONOS_6708.1 / gene=MONOS_6708 / organism=Monocercomonoides_exilis_PA203 / gene_product=putative malonyl-CoA:pyruvate transcarboxylase / transcript_product=putative malonyl-CoA:pyruvate transcarboxylase / location=Mono_scaffold00216:36567-40386(-) / protein_length=1075 / sequence_SO=supercontig / SO=protein_coding / is_pseudo=false
MAAEVIKKPIFEDIASTDFLKFSFGAKPYEAALKTEIAKTETLCGVRAFVVEHEGLKYVRADMDFKVFGGSLGCAEGEKLTLAFEYATANKLGIVISTRSGGVRMQEGTVALMMMAKVSVAAAAHKKAGLPFITVFEDPTYGGVSASYAMQADVRIGIKGTRIGFAGPGVILNTMYNQKQNQYDKACPPAFQSAQFLYEHGQLDLLVDSEEEAIKLAEQIFSLLVFPNKEVKPKELPALSEEEQFTTKRVIEQKDHNRGRMLDRVQAQDICFNVLEDYVELNGDGKIGTDSCIHGGLARLPVCCECCCKKDEEEKGEKGEKKKCHCGRTVVVIGTFKAHTQGEFASMGYGMATPHGYRTARRLFDLAEEFGLPCVTLVDTVGAEPSFSAETDGQSEAIAETLTAEQKALTKENAKAILDAKGPGAVKEWIMAHREKRVLITDTTLRDAHQSLLATRMRTSDMVGAAEEMSKVMNNAFSLEMWGGATFDVALRFLKEDPWERVRELRKRIPNLCFQALLRGSNVVGYTNYPDNAVEEFCRVAAEAGIDVFRIFDCFNDVEKMKSATRAVIKANKIAEVCICYTGDFNDPKEKVYTLEYYASLAKSIEGIGAHILGIKDMAGLLKPQNAEAFMKTLRGATSLPVHFHTHNTSGNALATCLMMAQHGCEIIDLAVSSMSDLTSQPSLNAFLAATERSPRPALIPFRAVEPLASYFGVVRSYYRHLESGQLASTARVYEHEIPGGQYTNLLSQSKALNIWDKWDQALDMYRDCNKMLGNLIKVTPSSKCVGDLALFLLGKGLTTKDVMEGKIDITYPESVKGLFKGNLGYPHHWKEPYKLSPEFLALRERVLKGEKVRGAEEALPPIDFGKLREMLRERLKREPTDRDVISHIMYPPVFEGYLKFVEQFGTMATFVPTPLFFYGMEVGQQAVIRLPAERIDEDLKAALSLAPSSSSASSSSSSSSTESDVKSGEMIELNVELKRISPIDADSTRKVIIKVNGVEFVVKTEAKLEAAVVGTKADLKDKTQFAAPMPGIVSEVKVAVGDAVKKGQVIGKITAMKMDVMLEAPFDGKVMVV